MTRHTTWILGFTAFVTFALLGCERRDELKSEMKDLQEAQHNAPEKAQQLQKDLDSAKAQVANLEQKLALAKQGVTDDVVREREDLKRAVKDDEKHVDQQVREAQGAANTHNTDVQKAEKALEQTQPAGRVETQVKTETQVVPNEKRTEVVHERQTVPVERTRVVEEQQQQQPGK